MPPLRPAVLSLAVLAGAALLAPAPAEARLTVCNRTQEAVRVALGQERPGGGWGSQGWWMAAPGACVRLVDAPLRLLEYYLRAEPVKPGAGWGGDFPFCVGTGDFSIEGDQECEKRGHRTAGFFAIATDGATAVTHNLTD